MKRKQKQSELFSVDDMYECVGVKDEVYAVSVAAYLWAIRQVSDLDDEKIRKVKKECDAVKIGGEEYFIPSIPGSMNIYKLSALRDCLGLRDYAIIGEKYVHHDSEAYCKPHVLEPTAFKKARKAFRKYQGKKYEENSRWLRALEL